MNIEEIKKIPIADYLQSLGYTPTKQQGVNLWYKSPLRTEHTPSFKVNAELNKWFDFGLGKGVTLSTWQSNSIKRIVCLSCWNELHNKLPMCALLRFLFISNHSNQVFNSLKQEDLYILHC